MSSKNYFPEYTLEIKNEMLTRPLDKEGFFVTHFVAFFQENEVTKNLNTFLKPEYRKPVFDKIKKSILAL
jgi:hypothetical protein